MQRSTRIVFVFSLIFISAPLTPAASYSFTTFNPTGLTNSTATGINDGGQVSGFGSGPTSLEGFVYDHGASVSFSAPRSADNITRAASINNSGVVVGMAIDYDGHSSYPASGFIYDHGVFTNDAYYGAPNGSLFGINDAGEVVGRNSLGQPFFRDQSGMNHVLSGPAGASDVYFSSINNREEVGGSYQNPLDAFSHAVIYRAGVYTELPAQYTSVVALNNLGQALVSVGNDSSEGVLDPDGTFTPLLLPASFFQTYVFGLNDAGQIVGTTSVTGSSGSFAFIASPTAVPEPASLLLGGIGLAVLFRLVQMRSRSH